MNLFLVERVCDCGGLESIGVFSDLSKAKSAVRATALRLEDELEDFHDEEGIWDTSIEEISYFINPMVLDEVIEFEGDE